MVDLKQALDKAASSPDPAMRGVALHFKMLEQEMGILAGFFEIYHKGASAKPVAVAASAAPAPVASSPIAATVAPSRPSARAIARAKAAKSRAKLGQPPDQFALTVAAIIVEAGAPMKLSHIYEAYQARCPEDRPKAETFRQRMVKLRQRNHIQLVLGQGYWPTVVGSDDDDGDDNNAPVVGNGAEAEYVNSENA